LDRLVQTGQHVIDTLRTIVDSQQPGRGRAEDDVVDPASRVLVPCWHMGAFYSFPLRTEPLLYVDATKCTSSGQW